MSKLKYIEDFLRQSYINDDKKKTLREFNNLNATLLFSYQQPCLFQGMVYDNQEPIMTIDEFYDIERELEKKY